MFISQLGANISPLGIYFGVRVLYLMIDQHLVRRGRNPYPLLYNSLSKNEKIIAKNNKIILLSMIFSLFTSIFLFFDAFLIIQFFAENQRLIFDEKMDNQTSVKTKNMIKKKKNHQKNNKYVQTNDKMLQKRKIYKT